MSTKKTNPRAPESDQKKHIKHPGWGIALLLICISLFFTSPVLALDHSGESVYKRLSAMANASSAISLEGLNNAIRKLSWTLAEPADFVGNLRIIRNRAAGDGSAVYLLRKLTGEVYLLSIPREPADYGVEADSLYAGLDGFSENKMRFRIETMPATIKGHSYNVAKFTALPEQVLMDKIFKICIILMLFFVMVGMGMTLTLEDFSLVFKKPKGIIIGQLLQFGVMPLPAMILGHLLGFHKEYPFIFVGMILITAIPGGVTSNLMTYYGKGDLALSISLTSFSTVLSILFTPLLLAFYCSNMPEVSVPVKVVIQTILILVIIPLTLGMGVRSKWETAAKKATPFFSALGIISLFVLIAAGIIGNLDMFADTARYGIKFYTTIFLITMLGMILGILISKLFGIGHYQTRAISLETGLRNSALAMTIAILIQDSMGDFHSSMFVTSGIFGLIMYLSGGVSIFLYKYILPLEKKNQAS